MTLRIRALVTAVVFGLVAIAARAGAQAPTDACTEPEAPIDPACLPGGTAGQLQQHLCSYVWIASLCDATAFPDPGYKAGADPSPALPFQLRAGAVHEHSSYSDGDPTAIPADYYRAARTGHNQADEGGDTGVKLDFMLASEHSDNTQIPITTSAACIDTSTGTNLLLPCFHGSDMDHYWKWPASLRQAREASDASFTGIRGFEWTNDYFNHMNVYFSTNFSNVKVDGSYLSMDFFWNWLREPVTEGGGADGLVTFNHPGGDPHLTPFDGGFPHTEVLAQFPGGGNWNDLAHVPDVDERVAGMEVNGGDDIQWYVKALTRGWHIGPLANEDEHEREWSSSHEGKTLILTRGTGPRDYYWAMKNHRTIAIHDPLVGGAPGKKATFPTMHYYADGAGINDPAATVLGSTIRTPGPHTLRFTGSGLPGFSRLALISNRTGGQSAPIQLGTVAEDGTVSVSRSVDSPARGEDWYFVVVCPASGSTRCGSDLSYTAVTAPIWLAAPKTPKGSGASSPRVKVGVRLDLL
ncbi:MAG: hypothetical protein ACRDKJ_05325 [Actinomycetota bacterium]